MTLAERKLEIIAYIRGPISEDTLFAIEATCLKDENYIKNKAFSDPIDRMIFEGGLRIRNVWFDKETDLMIVLLNNKKIIKIALSEYKLLSTATNEELEDFENDGVGIFWPQLDEDLSLRGFIKYALMNFDIPIAV